MRRNPNSTRSLRWIERNSLSNPSCANYVTSLLNNRFGMSTYKIAEYDTEEPALWITYGLFSYILKIDSDNICIKVLEQRVGNTKDRYHTITKTFSGDSCWYECFLWITKR